MFNNHLKSLDLLYIKNDGVDLVCDGPEKHKNNFFKIILSQKSIRRYSFGQVGLGWV
jgi:hypothetical protein